MKEDVMSDAPFIDPRSMTPGEQYKFIKFNDSKYVWWMLDIWCLSHSEASKRFPNLKPVAAGLINFKGSRWIMLDSYSATLKIGCAEEIWSEISGILGVEHVDSDWYKSPYEPEL